MVREREGKGKSMSRKYAVIAVLLWVAATSRAFALGLGTIEVQSSLNDPFKAVIELISATDEELEELKVSIASRKTFQQHGIPRPQILSSFLFDIERTSAGMAVIRISTRDPVHEAFLEFLLEVAWTKGRFVRQYTVLIDPPYTMPAIPAAPATPPVTRAPPAPAPAPVPVQPAPAVSKPASVPVPPAPAPATRTPAPDTYGPIRRNETLWVIAKKLRPDNDTSMDQMMLALQRANPRAFIDNNINKLRAGAVLAVPNRGEIQELSTTDAGRETSRQYSEWKSGSAAPVTAAAEPDSTADSATVETETVETETRLQLVAPEEDAVEAASIAGTAGADELPEDAAAAKSDLQQQLAMATDAAAAKSSESDGMQSRVTELEDQVDDLQRLLLLKDAQLASLQYRQAATDDAPLPGEDAATTVETADEETTAPESQDEAGAGEGIEDPSVMEEPNGLMDRLLDNPVLTALGVIVAMVLGGFLWASTRQRKHEDLFSDEPTLASRLSEVEQHAPEPVTGIQPRPVYEDTSVDTDEFDSLEEGESEGDPMTEADVFIAYGRLQQAEDVIQDALVQDPENRVLKVKLLDIYHAAGNTTAFDTHAEEFRKSIDADDPVWSNIAALGRAMSPDNPAYKSGTGEDASPDVDFDMDLSGMDDGAHAGDATVDEDLGLDYEDTGIAANDLPDNVDFSLDNLDEAAEGSVPGEDEDEGILDSSDEVSTKLDLARAYIDMGDPESARNILEEVLEEGDEEQKSEAENLFSKVS